MSNGIVHYEGTPHDWDDDLYTELPKPNRRILYGEFPQPDKRLFDLAYEYESRCEAFDKSVCSGDKDGVAMPVGVEEFRKINAHASLMRRIVERKAAEIGYTWADVKQEMGRYKDVLKVPRQPVNNG